MERTIRIKQATPPSNAPQIPCLLIFADLNLLLCTTEVQYWVVLQLVAPSFKGVLKLELCTDYAHMVHWHTKEDGLFQHRSTVFNRTCTAVCGVLDRNLEESLVLKVHRKFTSGKWSGGSKRNKRKIADSGHNNEFTMTRQSTYQLSVV